MADDDTAAPSPSPNDLINNLSISSNSSSKTNSRRDAGGRGGSSSNSRGRGGKSSRGGGGGEMDREVAISKALSKLLRHDAENVGLALDNEGFARVDLVLQYPRLKSLRTTFTDLEAVVSNNAKQRFSLKPSTSSTTTPSDWLIRANQGHSITSLSSSQLLSPLTIEDGNIPATVVHGSYFVFYPLMVKSGGLSRMGRNHVHFATGVPESSSSSSSSGGGSSRAKVKEDDDAGAALPSQDGDVETTEVETAAAEPRTEIKSGMRTTADLLIYIDVPRSISEGGLKWWMSDNGVVLTEGDEKGFVPTRFWKLVVGRREDVGVLWRDGVEVGSLPEGWLKGRRGPGNGFAGRGRGRGRGRGGRG